MFLSHRRNHRKLNSISTYLLSLLLLCSKSVVGDEIKIKSSSEFKDFVNNVNSGTSYSGTTVYLDSDIDFAYKAFEPIGNSTSNQFRGIFDGQGHIIKGLTIIASSSSYFTGLFGYSTGLTIRNVVLDSSCSIASSYSGAESVYMGGIIGYCNASSQLCVVENAVCMADVTFNGAVSSKYLYLGGIAGRLQSSSDHDSYVKNCANYGSVTHSGTSKYSYIGGIVGYLHSTSYKYIYNCLNYGAITHSGTTSSSLRLGGIAGHSTYTYIENCVSAGKISSLKTYYIGSIVGYVDSYTHVNYCYHVNDIGTSKLYGSGSPSSSSYTLSYDSATFELNETVSIGKYAGNSLVNALNTAADYYILRDYTRWLLNKDKNSVGVVLNGRTNPITMNYNVIILPSPTTEGNMWFNGWYTDSEYVNPIKTYVIAEDTILYGKIEENINEYTITFDTRGGGSSIEPVTAQFGTVVSLPSECIAYWETEYGDNVGLSLTMPAHNITLYAVWKCTRIASADDFVYFSKVVNSGSTYSGTTVFLDSDLSLSGKTLEPIGKDASNYFRGVFDGQGYIIGDLKLSSSSSSEYTGLFGYSKGLTIKNIVLDSSCFMTSSYAGSDHAYAGGIIGYCYSNSGHCSIENSVNMADVAFNGAIGNSYLYLGGVAGYLQSHSSYTIHVKNCANYGSVTHSGASKYSCIGGIIGDLHNSYYKYLQNTINYGTITHNGTSSSGLYLGGLVGYSTHTHIENCASAGKISAPIVPSANYTGSIVGKVDYYTYLHYCYYASDIGAGRVYGTGTPTSSSYVLSYDSASFELSENVSVGSYTGDSLIDALNAAATDYYVLDYYSNWILNKDDKTVKFTINSDRTNPITMDYRVILLPSLANEGDIAFDGWYSDVECTKPLKTFVITEDTDLYAKFEEITNNYTITFDTRREGVYAEPITAQFGSTVSLPSDLLRDNCSIAFWETKYGDNAEFSLLMPAHNITLYAVWKCVRIASADDFVDFSKVVNSGSTYSGTTVFLDSDLSLSGYAVNPIGKSTTYSFNGVFDGQGHAISGLALTSSSSSTYTGLFGYSSGTTIRNVVLDSSCSVLNSYVGLNSVYVGGIMGYCDTNYGQCNIENSVNMADATFSGSINSNSYSLYLGGVAGYLYSSSSHKSYVRNCANYGSVTDSGKSSSSYIGGIVSILSSLNSCYAYIYNCFNYGMIANSGTTSNELRLGGIIGHSTYTHVENCVSAGEISTPVDASTDYVGSIVGYVESYTHINNCYYTSDVGTNIPYGEGRPKNSTGTPESPTTVDLALISGLNDYASGKSWNRWLLNADKASVLFVIGRGNGFALKSQIILLPDPVGSNGYAFSGWFEDPDLTSPFVSEKVDSDTTLYGDLCVSKYIVTLDVNGGDELVVKEITVEYNAAYGTLPTPTRTGHTFAGWFTENGRLVTNDTIVTIASDHTLRARWNANQYTVTLDVNGGDELKVTSVVVTFNNTYGTLPMPTKTGHTFVGWFVGDNENVTSDTVVTTASNHTLCAHWAINRYTLTFVFNNGTAPEVRNPEFGEVIVYPENPKREDYIFLGWDKIVSNMPANDLTITALWKQLPDKQNASSSISASLNRVIAIAIIECIVICIVVILIIVGFLFYNNKK